MSSKGCVATGNHGVSYSQHLRPIGLPLNSMECVIFHPSRVKSEVLHKQIPRSSRRYPLPVERINWSLLMRPEHLVCALL
jgi:hypothetical protein